MHFDSATGRLQCDYCGSSYEVSEIEALYADKNAAAADAAAKAEEKRASANRKDGGVDGWQLEDTGTGVERQRERREGVQLPELRR